MFETILYASFTVNVLLLCMCVVLWSRMTDAENAERVRTKELSDAREKVKAVNDDLAHEVAKRLRDAGELQKRIAGLQAELDKEKAKHEDKAPSPWAKDIPTARHFEVVTMPTEAVTLRTSVVVAPYDLEALTKDRLMRELSAELLTQAAQFIEVEQRNDIPCMIGTEFVGYLRVYRRVRS